MMFLIRAHLIVEVKEENDAADGKFITDYAVDRVSFNHSKSGHYAEEN